MSVYILQKDEVDFFGNKTAYYIHDDFSNGGHSVVKTRYEAEAKRYTLDDAMTMAKANQKHVRGHLPLFKS